MGRLLSFNGVGTEGRVYSLLFLAGSQPRRPCVAAKSGSVSAFRPAATPEQFSSEVRIVRGANSLGFWLLVLVLALGVATIEAPEFASLTNDVSNDAVVVTLEDAIPKLISRPLCRGETTLLVLTNSFSLSKLSKKRSWFGPALASSSTTGKEVLHLLSLQRI
jgi:hypothetical protein